MCVHLCPRVHACVMWACEFAGTCVEVRTRFLYCFPHCCFETGSLMEPGPLSLDQAGMAGCLTEPGPLSLD